MYTIKTKQKLITVTTKKVVPSKKLKLNANQYVGFKIKEIRTDKKILQQDLANALKMSRANLSNIETGRTNITITALEKICKQLGILSINILPF